MNALRVWRPISDTAVIVIRFAANAINCFRHDKILLFGAFAALLAVVAVPTFLLQVDIRPVAASSTLKCYDSAGNDEPCGVQASASAPQSNGQTSEAHRPAIRTTIGLYQQESWVISALAQPASWTTSAPATNEPAASEPATNEPATNEPATRRSSASARRQASAACGRHVIPCVFSALRRGVTHLAYVAANASRARPAREYR